MEITHIYTISNNTDTGVSRLNLWDIFAVGHVDSPGYVDVPAGESVVLYGNDGDIVRITRAFKAKCAFLGLDYGKNDLMLYINQYVPEE